MNKINYKSLAFHLLVPIMLLFIVMMLVTDFPAYYNSLEKLFPKLPSFVFFGIYGLVYFFFGLAAYFIEEAEGYRQLIQECGVTQEELAMKLGKSQSTIANKMRILKLPPEIINIISQEKLSERHARSLLKLPDKELQMQVLKEVVEKKLSVRETEELIDRTIKKINDNKKEEKSKSFKIAIKDVRIFLNSVRKLVKTIKETGIQAEYKEIDKGEFIELQVQLPKR